MPTITLSTGSLYSYGIARVFELATEAGFEAIEVLIDHRWDSRQPAYLRRLSLESGLPIVTVHSPFVPSVPGWPSDPMGRLRESAALARQLGAGVVVTHLPLRVHGARIEFFGISRHPLILPMPLPVSGDYRRFLLNGLSRFEDEEGVRVGVENMPAKRILGRRVDMYRLNTLDDLANLPHLTLDTTHLGTWGLDPAVAYERLKERIIHVHLSNFDGREHRLPQEGYLSTAEFLQSLRRNGYEGAVSVELDPDALQPEDEAQVRVRLQSVVAFCREHLERG
ncbi:MAG: sugar phosphate isomerase/epimerase family protein [Anaerolineae bacterium]|jgi:sugar phosphate isomerase/epimerase